MAPKSSTAKDPDIHKVERLQVPYSTNAPAFGSDVVAETLSALDIPYIALNPGASYRGLHDSIVNFLGNEQPQMILCLHEEAAVAIAHGYAKVTGKAMAAAVHSNVGLFHATMAIFNAGCAPNPGWVGRECPGLRRAGLGRGIEQDSGSAVSASPGRLWGWQRTPLRTSPIRTRSSASWVRARTTSRTSRSRSRSGGSRSSPA